jgi:hypothetical protein
LVPVERNFVTTGQRRIDIEAGGVKVVMRHGLTVA